MKQASTSALVVWLTGLSGAGKTTLAKLLVPELRGYGLTVAHVDGDTIRELLGSDLGHSPEERVKNAYRMSRFCKFLSEQGVTVVCSTMSLYPEIWEWNRKEIKNYFEVYLKVSKETVIERDPKGLYQKAKNGKEANIVGIDLPFNEPKEAHFVLENDQVSTNEAFELLKKAVLTRIP